MNKKNMLKILSLLVVVLASSCGEKSISGENEMDIEVEVPVSIDFACSECDFILDPETGVIDGSELGIEPGDIVCFSGSGETYQHITFSNIVGSASEPIIFRNCDGQAIVESAHSFGLKFKESKYLKIIGDGHQESDYGIKISTEKGFFLTFEEFSTNLEVSKVEIAGYEPRGLGEKKGFAGIGVKTSPYQACDVFVDPDRQAWIMEDIIVRNCYIHDTGGEGIYMGHGFYNGRKEGDCDQVTWSHSIHGVRIYDNRIEDTGFDGIQIKNVDQDCEVYNNVIRNYGQRDEGAHNEGLFIGEGTTGKFYNNIIINGTGHGIQFQGMGNVDIYNNVVVNAGDNGFFGASGKHAYRIPDGYFNIINNTIVQSGEHGFVFFNNDGGVKRLINNIIAGSVEEPFKKGATLESSNNIIEKDISSLDFADAESFDYSIGIDSDALDEGIDVTEYGITEDLNGMPRPVGGDFDIGAFEAR